jgi:hypothetical protein
LAFLEAVSKISHNLSRAWSNISLSPTAGRPDRLPESDARQCGPAACLAAGASCRENRRAYAPDRASSRRLTRTSDSPSYSIPRPDLVGTNAHGPRHRHGRRIRPSPRLPTYTRSSRTDWPQWDNTSTILVLLTRHTVAATMRPHFRHPTPPPLSPTPHLSFSPSTVTMAPSRPTSAYALCPPQGSKQTYPSCPRPCK